MLRLAFDMRTAAGCDKPLVTTGFADTLFTDELSGKVGPRGLVALEMRSDPTTLTSVCASIRARPTRPCAGGLASYPVKVSVHVTVKISLKRVAGLYTPSARGSAEAATRGGPKLSAAARQLARPDVRAQPARPAASRSPASRAIRSPAARVLIHFATGTRR